MEDLFALEEWRLHSPDVPEGPWCKDGSFKLCGEGQYPKTLESFAGQPFELVVNLSGQPFPLKLKKTRLIEWSVRDPIGESEAVYRAVAAQIEGLVMRLIIELRGK